MDNTQEYILCAALWFDDGIVRPHPPRNITSGLVVGGWRHHNCYTQLNAALPTRSEYEMEVQGFLTSRGNFVDREQAAHIALAAGQLTEAQDRLFSEDVW